MSDQNTNRSSPTRFTIQTAKSWPDKMIKIPTKGIKISTDPIKIPFCWYYGDWYFEDWYFDSDPINLIRIIKVIRVIGVIGVIIASLH